MVLWHGMVLQLLEFVARWEIAELFSTVVVQDGACGLLAGPISNNNSVSGRHGHGRDANGHLAEF